MGAPVASLDAKERAEPAYILKIGAMKHVLQELHGLIGDMLFPATIDAAARMAVRHFGAAEVAKFLRDIASHLDCDQERPH